MTGSPPTPQPNVQLSAADLRLPPRLWLLVVLTGAGAGLGGGLLMRLLQFVQHVCWSYTSGTFLDGVKQSTAARHVIVLLCAGLVAGLGRWLFRSATGGHFGELSETIWFRSGKLPTVPTLGKAVLSIGIVGMGASLGREGALKQTGAAIAARLSAWARLSAPQVRLLAAYGAGAGMAAAYNVPCGGALFALEVLLGGLTLPLVVPALAASGIATAVSWLLLPNRPTYTIPADPFTLAQLLWALLAGPLLGLAAVLYVRVIAWADARKPRGWRLVLAPVLVFAVLGCVSLVFPQLLGNGKGMVRLAYANKLGIGLLLALPVLKVLATAGCLGSGAPGGLFTPSLACGALLGGLLGFGWGLLWPGAPPGSYAIIGSAAFLAAATQGPVSAVVLVLELTWWTTPLMVPLLVAVAGATLTARRLETRSIYSARIRLGAAAAAAIRPPCGELCAGVSLVPSCEVVSAATRYTELVRRLLALPARQETLYVVDERGRLVGEITADHASRAVDPLFPLETTTASDLATPAEPVTTSAPREEVVRRLGKRGVMQLPVVDAATGRFLGAVTLATDDQRPAASD